MHGPVTLSRCRTLALLLRSVHIEVAVPDSSVAAYNVARFRLTTSSQRHVLATEGIFSTDTRANICELGRQRHSSATGPACEASRSILLHLGEGV